METLYKILLDSKYTLVYYYGPKAFTFEENNGDWKKQLTISKYRKLYCVSGFEGIPNMIKTFNKEFSTYKEVLIYLGL